MRQKSTSILGNIKCFSSTRSVRNSLRPRNNSFIEATIRNRSRWNTLPSYPYSMLHRVGSACLHPFGSNFFTTLPSGEREGGTTVPIVFQQSDTDCGCTKRDKNKIKIWRGVFMWWLLDLMILYTNSHDQRHIYPQAPSWGFDFQSFLVCRKGSRKHMHRASNMRSTVLLTTSLENWLCTDRISPEIALSRTRSTE